MRTKLSKHFNKRSRFRGIFIKYGRKSGFKGRVNQTVLLQNIFATDNPKMILTDHLWFNFTKGFQDLDLLSGDIIEFSATVRMYQKGYSDEDAENPIRLDYHLEYPRNIKKVGHAEGNYSQNDIYNKEIAEKIIESNRQRQEFIQQRLNSKSIDANKHPIISQSSISKKMGRDTTLFNFFKRKAKNSGNRNTDTHSNCKG